MKPSIYYSINGVDVFLALPGMMPKDVKPHQEGTRKNAYLLSDFDLFCDFNNLSEEEAEPYIGLTYNESYAGMHYAENGAEICTAIFVNCENEQYTIEDWALIDELDEINEELKSKGFALTNIP